MDRIILIFLSDIENRLTARLKSRLESTFNRSVEIRYKVSDLGSAYNPIRKQYISPRLLSRLKRIKKDSNDKILGVVEVDLYSPGYDFIYGEADIFAGVATLSIRRLISEGQDIHSDNLFEERVAREAIHELGHLYGLGHCPNPKCVMRTCTCLAEVDEAGNDLCITCRNDLNTRVIAVS